MKCFKIGDMKIIAHIILCCFFLIFGSAPAWAEGIEYSFAIEGIKDEKLKTKLQGQSLLVSLADKNPANSAALNRRIKSDLKSFKALMQEQGYFNASFEQNITEKNDKKIVVVTVDKGPLYTIERFDIDWASGQTPDIKALTDFEPPIGQAALPETMLESEQNLFNILMQNGYFAPKSEGKTLRVHHGRHSVSLSLSMSAGPQASFGKTEITGLKKLKESFVRRRIGWREGELFDIGRIARTRKKLNRSGVMASTEIHYGALTDEGALPITIEAKEGKHRSIGAGVAYSTTLGAIANVFWEHRNLFGGSEKFRIKLEGGTKTSGLSANLNKPDLWGNEKLGLQNAVVYKRELLEAFDKDTLSSSTVLNYKYSNKSAISGGVALEQNKIIEEGEKDENFTLISLPLSYRYDDTNDALDPREGWRFNLGVTPYQVLNEQDSFLVTSAGGSHYWPLGEDFVWANKARAAFIHGLSLDRIPADKRFYAGGGGSVRGYGYQILGPLDEDNDPTGGRMVFELGTEGRFKVTESIELVGFVEGARVSEDLEWSSAADFLWGAGSGLRYHTPIGPLRFDFAVPLNKRPQDDSYQFYISIGQAF
tara:strand:+ start:50444 stop:52228 length:1785 start_codon:yes stop_codon:yes gene_type:complete